MTDNLKQDMEFLLQRPEFLRFLWRVIQTARIFARTTDGSEGRNLAYDEGARHLGLHILEMAETGQPVGHPEAFPLLTLMQVFREESQTQPEKPNGRRYDRNSELRDADEPVE